MTGPAACCGGACDCAPAEPLDVPQLADASQVRLTDVNGSTVAELVEATRDQHSALAGSIRHLVNSLDDPNGVISAFSSFVE